MLTKRSHGEILNTNESYIQDLKHALNMVSTVEKAQASRRYFPNGIHCIGATAADIKLIIVEFQSHNPQLTAPEMLSISECLLKNAQYSEEVLLAFGLINKLVKNNYDASLLLRFEFWLEHYATNWSHVDDLCIKTIYQFLLSRPELIDKTQHWASSQVPWCRRASNVVWVKFIKRKMGKSTYYLDKALVFNNCDLLLCDEDEFVQKSVGWLLKATSSHHQQAVVEYVEKNVEKMTRATLRYAIEKLDEQTRQRLLRL